MPPHCLARRLSSALAAALVLATSAVAVPQASAATILSVPLHTAVRQLPVAPEQNVGYDRDRDFGDWIDADGDCQSTRHEVLVAESQVAPTLAGTGCTVTAGRWVPFYDGMSSTSPGELQVDHLVPLAEAWGSGAQAWTQAQRVAFSNDLGYAWSLNAMPAALNQAKSDRGPESWLPPAGVCRYVEAWTAVKIRWGLRADAAEQAALIAQADACPNTTVSVELSGVTPSTPDPTPTSPPALAKPLLVLGSAVVASGSSELVRVTGGAPGARVELYAATLPNTAFRLIRSGTVDAQGAAAWSLAPGGHTNLYAVVDGRRSDATTLRVLRTVTLGVRQASGVYRFSGVVRRPVAGLQVTLARVLSTGRVVGVGSTRTNSLGAYAISSRLSPGTNLYYVLTGSTPDMLAARSSAYGLAVPAPAVATRVATPVRAPATSVQPPARPADVDCADFATQAQAQAFHDRWFPSYGDFARLDGSDDDGRACESLP